MMKTLLFCLVAMVSLTVQAGTSFRLDTGKLLKEGQTKPEVIALAGAPLSQEIETIAVDDGRGGDPVKRETLTYRLNGTIGGMYLVVVVVENGNVVSIWSRQEERI